MNPSPPRKRGEPPLRPPMGKTPPKPKRYLLELYSAQEARIAKGFAIAGLSIKIRSAGDNTPQIRKVKRRILLALGYTLGFLKRLRLSPGNAHRLGFDLEDLRREYTEEELRAENLLEE